MVVFQSIFLGFALVCIVNVAGQENDLDELATTLSQQEVPVRLPQSQIKFNKDRKLPNITKRIIGGDVATAHEYPYQVALYVYVQITQYFCGGSLITPQWVLTAAHCVEYASSIIVILGSHNLNEAESSRLTYNTSTYTVHEGWDELTLQYDIAVIKLPERVTLNLYINTVPIAYGGDTYVGLIGRCLGWGRTTLGSLSNVLRYVDAEVITNENCSSYSDDYLSLVVDQHLCASGEGYIGNCNGDSGGPLIINGIQVGIVSWGHVDCSAGYPSVYTRLTEFYTWVNETIGNNETNGTDETNENTGPKTESTVSLTVVAVLGILLANYV